MFMELGCTYVEVFLCRSAAAMDFANQFPKACAYLYELLFLISCLFPSFLPSFSPSSCNKTFERARQLIHSEKITPSSHHCAFISLPDLKRICIHANRLSPVQDLPILHIVLEAAISVSRFYSTGQTHSCML